METGSTDNSTMKDVKKEEQLEKEGVVRSIKKICEIIEKGLAAHFSIFVWRIPWTEEPGVTESDMTEMTEHVELLIFLGVIMILWL